MGGPAVPETPAGTFTKTASPGDNLPGEAAALRWLAEAEPAGGIRVARVLRASADELVEERIVQGAPSAGAARRIGASLARTHAAGAPWLGCPPAGWEGPLRCGRFPVPYVRREEASSSWGAFYAEHRVMTHVRSLVDRGDYGPSELHLFERVSARLASGELDAPQPELVRASGAPAARIHGDLWAGNVLWDADPDAPTGGVLIDPMAQGGHAETDLAMLALFGFPFLREVIAGYEEVSPLADGWRERVALHQLSPLLLHCELFGGWYLGEALDAARRYA